MKKLKYIQKSLYCHDDFDLLYIKLELRMK